MAPQRKPWFRFYVEAITSDLKIRRMDVKYRWLWVAVLGAARQSPVPGSLLVTEKEPFTVDDLADFAAMKAKEVATGMEKFEATGLVTRGHDGEWIVAKWAERQFEGDFSRARIPQEVASRVFAKCNYACVECGATEDLEIDHIVPRTKGGSDEESNLQVLCGPCNRRKGNRLRQQKHRHTVTAGRRDRSQQKSNEVTSRLCTEAEAEADPDPETDPGNGCTNTHAQQTDPAAAPPIDQAIGILIDRRLHAGGDRIGNPGGYRAAMLRKLRDQHAEAIASLPDLAWTPESLADWLEPAGTPTRPTEPPPPRPADGCTLCEGRGTIYDETTDTVTRCDHQVPAR